ncbi:LysM domain-containing protein [Photobacterium lutimaris]|nr:LysM domain-containing protein [Photobacterium lutimaris]
MKQWKKVSWGVWLVVASMGGAVYAQSLALSVKEGAPAVYTVKKGDTLWDISAHYLASPWRWPELWQSNRNTVADPHWIYPGDQLHLHFVGGQPRLLRKPVRYLSPKIKVTPKPVTTLPAELLLPYLAEDKLLMDRERANLPHVIGDSLAQGYIARGGTIWVDTPLVVGDRWGIYRSAPPLERKLASGEMTKISSLKEVARGEVVSVTEMTSAVVLTDAYQEVKPNDVLLPAPLPKHDGAMSFSPSPSPAASEAEVVATMGGMAYIATHEVVVLNQGHLDGLEAGHVLSIIRPGAGYTGDKGNYEYSEPDTQLLSSSLFSPSKSGRLQDILIGEVIVIRPYEYFSLAVVTRAIEPFRVGARVVSPRKG